MITIGQLAAYAGVTVRAVRHYHHAGLLPEPPRDASGYRRYCVDDAVALIRIKALADAGVPLARIEELLAATPEELGAAVEDLRGDFDRRIAELTAMRGRIGGLVSGERLYVPADVADYLDRLRAAGLSPRYVQHERDGWILLLVTMPDPARGWLAHKSANLDDAEFVGLHVDYDRAFDWDPGDPRLEPLADRVVDWTRRHAGEDGPEGADGGDPALFQMIADATGGRSPAWRSLNRLVEDRLAT